MKIKNRFLVRSVGLAAATVFYRWMNTLDIRVTYYDPTCAPSCNPKLQSCEESGIHVCWHEYLPVPLYILGRRNMSLLISQHGDAELIAQAASFLGFGTIRGSSTRGGAAALREIIKSKRRFHIGVACDGPRGPRRRLSPGIIYMSSRLGMPIVCSGVGYDRPWRVNSWDRFAIPRLFSRCRVIAGPRYFVPPHLDRASIEMHRRCVEHRLETLTQEAEAWAASGHRRHDEQILATGKNPKPVGAFTAEPAALAGNAKPTNERLHAA